MEDADVHYANSAEGRSVAGSVPTFGVGNVVGVSRTQVNVSLSSTDAEYAAPGEAAKEMLFVRGSLTFIQRDVKEKCTTVLKTARVSFVGQQPAKYWFEQAR